MAAPRATAAVLAPRAGAPGRRRLLRADQAEGPVAAAADDGGVDGDRRRPVAGAGRRHLHRRLPVGRRRRRGQPLVRPRHRRADEAHGQPADPGGPDRPGAALWFGIALAVLSFVWLSATVNVLAASLALARLPRLRLRLHGLAQAPHAAEHRHRRGGRRRAAARRLGRRHRRPRPHGAVPVRDRLLLDAAALLGAVAADEGRLRARRRADAAGRARRGRDPSPDPALHRPALRRELLPACAGLFGPLYHVVRWLLGLAFIGLPWCSTAAPTGAGRCARTCSPSPTSRRCSP